MTRGTRRGTLLVHPGALGDLLQALPACGRVRAAWPHEPVTLVTGDPFADVARATGLFDAVLAFDAATAYHGSAARRLAVLAGLLRGVRAVRPARAGVLKGATVYATLARASGAPLRAGVTRSAAGARLLTVAVPLDGRTHREDHYARVAAALTRGAPRPDAPAAAPRWADVLPAAAAALEGGGPWLAIAPGGARNVKDEMPARRWPATHYGELASALCDARPELRVVLLGGHSDRGEADVVADAVRRALPRRDDDRLLDLVGRTTIPEARAVLMRCALLVCHDSALLHLAGDTPTPVVAVFGPTGPRVAAPRRAGITLLWQPARSEACHDEVTGRLAPCAAECCIVRVRVDAVRDAALAMLGGGG